MDGRDAFSEEGDGVKDGVDRVGDAASFPGAVTCFDFCFFLETHGDPWSS